jgi:outer membrane protein TolC
VTQIENIYWDLVNAYEVARVDEQSLAFAQQSLDNTKKELQLESVPAMDEMKAETEVSKRDQDLTVAKTTLELQESLIKNALTKSLDDPVLEEMPVVPTDTMQEVDAQANQPLADLIAAALNDRPELAESAVDLVNRQISRKAARNNLAAELFSRGLLRRHWPWRGRPIRHLMERSLPSCRRISQARWSNAYNNSAPDYFVGLNLQHSIAQPRS